MPDHDAIRRARRDLARRPRREFLSSAVQTTAGMLLVPTAAGLAAGDNIASTENLLRDRSVQDFSRRGRSRDGSDGSVFNIRDYGAAPGVDSTAPIQAAINDLVAGGGGVVYVPVGTYLISSALTIGGNGTTTGPNIALAGEGPHRSVIKNVGGGHAIDIRMKWGRPSGPYFDFWWFPRIAGLEIVGTSASGRGINIASAHVVVIEDCWIHEHGQEGVYAENAYVITMRDSYVSFCGIAGGHHGIHIQNLGHLTRFFGCASSQNSGSGFFLNNISNSLSLIGCDAESNGAYGIEVGSCAATVIHGGYLENNTAGDIHLWNQGCGADIRGMYLNGTKTAGIYIEEFFGVEISGCSCCSAHESFVRLKNADSRDVHVGKNHSSATYYVDGPATVYPHAVTSLHVDQCELSGQPYEIRPTREGVGNINRRIWWLSSTSTGVYDNIGDIVYCLNPTPGGCIGWVCTLDGAPGTWKMFGRIAS